MTTDHADIPKSVKSSFWYIPFLVIFIALVALTWANYRYTTAHPGGDNFFTNYVAVRSFIFDGQSPYSDETLADVQRLAKDESLHIGENQLRNVSPFYSFFLYVPVSLIKNFPLARAIWMTMLEVSILVMGILSIQLTGWRVHYGVIPFFLVFTLAWYHGFENLITGNIVVLVALFITGALMAIRKHQDILAGLLLALATIKPHLLVLVILFIMFWAFSHRRWFLMGWTFGWIFFLSILGVLFLPNWLMQNIWAILKPIGNRPVFLVGSLFEGIFPGIGTQLKWGLTILLILILLVEWWFALHAEFNRFLWTVCLTLAVSQWLGFITDPGVIVLLLPAITLIFSINQERWGRIGLWINVGTIIVLFFGLWRIVLGYNNEISVVDLSIIMFVPVPLLVILGLYWVRWWAIRPTRNLPGY